MVALLIFVVVGFIRGLEENLAVSGDPEVVLVHALGTEGNVEISSEWRRSMSANVSRKGLRYSIVPVTYVVGNSGNFSLQS